jgi:phenylacetate-CoA ligase
MEYWQPKFETMSRKQLEELQLKRLKKSANSVYKNVPFYKKKFDEAGIKPSDIKSVEDVRKLPFTRKTDLRDNYPFGRKGLLAARSAGARRSW